MAEPHTPQDELFLRDVETIKVFADERRLAILERMRRPNTVKAVAAALDLAPAKLYYHVNLLVEHGLLRVVDHNIDSGIVEKVYQVTARRFKLVNPLLAEPELPPDASAAVLGSLLSETRRDFLAALAARDAAEGTPPRHPFLSTKSFQLTEQQLTTLHARLAALMQDVAALGAADADANAPTYTLTVAFFKRLDETATTEAP